jgi:hypothetical protein
MSEDSLLDDLSGALDEGLNDPHHGWGASHPTVLPYVGAVGVHRRSKHLLDSAKASLAEDTKHFDYQGFVRFLADTPVPIVPKYEKSSIFLGSGWTMSVSLGQVDILNKPHLVAVKYISFRLLTRFRLIIEGS